MYFIGYLILINLFDFVIFGIDKSAARKGNYRISEKFLIISAFLGGALGGIIGMRFFHHKTRKKLFKIGLPIIFALNLIISSFAFYLIYVI